MAISFKNYGFPFLLALNAAEICDSSLLGFFFFLTDNLQCWVSDNVISGLFSSLNMVGRKQGHTWVRKGGNLRACHGSCVSTLCWNYSPGNFFAFVLLLSLVSTPSTQDGPSFLWDLPWGFSSPNVERGLSLWMHVALHTAPQIISNLGVHFSISGGSGQVHKILDERKLGGRSLLERISLVVLLQTTWQ